MRHFRDGETVVVEPWRAAAFPDEGCSGRTDTGACTVSCSTEIPLDVISQLNRDYRPATTGSRRTR